MVGDITPCFSGAARALDMSCLMKCRRYSLCSLQCGTGGPGRAVARQSHTQVFGLGDVLENGVHELIQV